MQVRQSYSASKIAAFVVLLIALGLIGVVLAVPFNHAGRSGTLHCQPGSQNCAGRTVDLGLVFPGKNFVTPPSEQAWEGESKRQ